MNTTTDQSSTTTPDLLIKLHELATRISHHGGDVSLDSMVERYCYFVTHSEYGRDCSYARKCRDLFLQYDYEEVRRLFLECVDLFRIVEPGIFDHHDAV